MELKSTLSQLFLACGFADRRPWLSLVTCNPKSRLSVPFVSLSKVRSELGKRKLCLSGKTVSANEDKVQILSKLNLRRTVKVWAAFTESVNYDDLVGSTSETDEKSFNVNDAESSANIKPKPDAFRNRFLNFARIGSIINNAGETFFKSEIRRRLFVTAVLIVMSRIGYFIPLPGFDRRLMPENYLSFISGSVDELGDLTPELKLSLFQLGISPQIAASIMMQMVDLTRLCSRGGSDSFLLLSALFHIRIQSQAKDHP